MTTPRIGEHPKLEKSLLDLQTPGLGEPPSHFLIFIPGYMGSRLRSQSTGDLVWLDIPALLRDPLEIPGRLQTVFTQVRYPNDDLVPDGVIDQMLFLPPFFKQEQYSRFFDAVTAWGYHVMGPGSPPVSPALYPFAYDWRQDNRISAQQLGIAIQKWKAEQPDSQAWIIAHSNGGIVARWYIENEGGKQHVDRLFLLASPWDGAPKTLRILQEGVDVFMLRLFNRFGIQRLLRNTALSFPSFYQLLPSHLPFLQDEAGKPFDPYKDDRWLEDECQRVMLQEALRFNQDLGSSASTETHCFFGIKQLTTSQGVVELSPDGRFVDIAWGNHEDGDGTVPVHSAIHPQATEKIPFAAGHGELYTHPALLDKLHFELVNRYRYGALAAVSAGRLKVQFETDSDVYAPGESIQVWADLSEIESGLPVFGARVEVDLLLSQLLLGVSVGAEEVRGYSDRIRLVESTMTRGRYEGRLVAASQPGYYEVRGRIRTKQDRPIETKELILIEPE
jgi:hypothetical protein